MPNFTQLARDIDTAMQVDRHRLRSQLRGLERRKNPSPRDDEDLARFLAHLEQSQARRAQRAASVPLVTFDPQLPITAHREQIAAALRDHQVLIVCGETGSGKSTQLPKICLELGRGVSGLIGHTQPRRIAARSVAQRVAEELGTPLGQRVGFKVRFSDATSQQTLIKLMTDGILLAETQGDRFLDQYDTLILDEAHERSLNIDFLLGYLHGLLPRRPDLKLIITSATLEPQRFSEHFATAAGPAPIIEVSGRSYPIEMRYRPLPEDEDTGEVDLERGVISAVQELATSAPGDVLVFMPTEQAIHATAKALRSRIDRSGSLDIVPLYARLSAAEQQRVFEPHSKRRVVIATNVAESSLTVPGIRGVIDSGTARLSRYSPRSKVQRLPIEPISQASADQRRGRCGRIGPGVCIRLYSEEDFASRPQYTAPEIQRTNLAAVILQLLSLRLGTIEDFPLLDAPRPDAIKDGYRTLFELGAIDDNRQLTRLGEKLSRLPVDPRIGRIVLAAHDEGCLSEVLIIAAALEIQDPRERPVEKQQAADAAHAPFRHAESDFLGYLQLWDFLHDLHERLSRSQFRKACKQNFLSYNRVQDWRETHRQLRDLAQQAGMRTASRRDQFEPIHRALLAGFLSGIAERGESSEYTVAGGSKAQLWPGSGLYDSKPKWIVAAELVETSRRYLRVAAQINPAWVEPLAEHLLNRSYSDPHWDQKSVGAMVYERALLWGLPIVPRRRVRYGGVNPQAAREMFIEHALVSGELESNAPFIAHNRALMEEMERARAKLRRGDFLLGDEARHTFFSRVIPPDVFDGASFERWRRVAERPNQRLLFMAPEDLVVDQSLPAAAENFPDAVHVEQMQLPLDYRLEPGAPEDGITLTVPREALSQVSPQQLGWLVPGLLEEKVAALIKTLPKSLRRRFVPVPETARLAAAQLKFGEGSLPDALALALTRLSGDRIAPTDFAAENLPNHLRMNVRVVDAQGATIAEGRDLATLREQAGGASEATHTIETDGQWQRDNLRVWDFEPLPEAVTVRRGSMKLRAFPALVDQGSAAGLRLFDHADQAARSHRAGLRRLFALAAHRELKAQLAWLPDIGQWRLCSRSAPVRNFDDELMLLLADRAWLADAPTIRAAHDFAAQLKRGHARLAAAVQEVTGVIGPLLERAQLVRLGLERLQAPQWRAARVDLEAQLNALVAPGFLGSTPWTWLEQTPRYLRAAVIRLEKLAAGGLARDQRNLAELAPRQAALNRELEAASRAPNDDAELEHYRWMLEELRVSLFAQELGTSQPVSAKRLDQLWTRIQSRRAIA